MLNPVTTSSIPQDLGHYLKSLSARNVYVVRRGGREGHCNTGLRSFVCPVLLFDNKIYSTQTRLLSNLKTYASYYCNYCDGECVTGSVWLAGLKTE